MSPPSKIKAEHGTNSKYHLGCRCGECAKAHRDYRREQDYRDGLAHPKVDATRVRPLVECLVGFGLERQRIARVAGCSAKTLRLKRPAVNRLTAKAVDDLHSRLWVNHEPFRRHCSCPASGRLMEWLGEESVEDRLKRAGVA